MAYDYRNHANFLFEFITSTLDHSMCWNVSSCSRKPVSTSENDLGLRCRVSGGAALLSTSHSDVTSRQEVRLAVVVGLPGSVLMGRLRNTFNTRSLIMRTSTILVSPPISKKEACITYYGISVFYVDKYYNNSVSDVKGTF